MNNERDRNLLVEAHRARWHTFGVWLGFIAALALAEGLLAWTVISGNYLLAIPATLLVAHLMHSQLLALHEAAHGVLCPNRRVNELIGLFIGKFHFVGLSLYRAAHHTHHAHLGTDKDEQLWPFTDPRTPRWLRRLAVVCELSLGMFFDAVLFWRAFLRKGSLVRNPNVRRRIWAEGAVTAAFWALLLGSTVLYGMGKWLLTFYLIPAVVAGNMQSLRKYIEHMGLTGSSVLGLTRTVVPAGPLGRLLAFTMFNIAYHGVHHRYARMPQASLPQFASVLVPQAPEEETIYPSYWSAFREMAPTLADPRVGPLWRHAPDQRLHGPPPSAQPGAA